MSTHAIAIRATTPATGRGRSAEAGLAQGRLVQRSGNDLAAAKFRARHPPQDSRRNSGAADGRGRARVAAGAAVGNFF
ncbi:MAG: hypothetical protein C3F17_12260, partial [Bradyrhizobiaceae bacterium]